MRVSKFGMLYIKASLKTYYIGHDIFSNLADDWGAEIKIEQTFGYSAAPTPLIRRDLLSITL